MRNGPVLLLRSAFVRLNGARPSQRTDVAVAKIARDATTTQLSKCMFCWQLLDEATHFIAGEEKSRTIFGEHTQRGQDTARANRVQKTSYSRRTQSYDAGWRSIVHDDELRFLYTYIFVPYILYKTCILCVSFGRACADHKYEP